MAPPVTGVCNLLARESEPGVWARVRQFQPLFCFFSTIGTNGTDAGKIRVVGCTPAPRGAARKMGTVKLYQGEVHLIRIYVGR